MAARQPQWQPLSMLPTLGPHIDRMLEAKPKPHMLDNATVNRVISVFTIQRDDLALFDEQLRRWGIESELTQAQRAEITCLKKQMAKVRQVNTDMLKLAEELKKGTIENILAMDDAELGLRFLLDDLPGSGLQ